MDWSAKLKEIAQQVVQAEQQAQSWQARIVYLRGQRDLCAEELKKMQEAEEPKKKGKEKAP